MSFKENLKDAMYLKNMKTSDLAKKTGLSSGTISSYLKTNGSMPPADKALKLAQALDVSIEFLINGFETKNNSTIYNSSFPVEIIKIASEMSVLKKDELEAIRGVVNVLKHNKLESDQTKYN